METPHSSLLKDTLIPAAEANGYRLYGDECDETHFGNAVVTFHGPRARVVAVKDRSYWSFYISDSSDVVDDVEIAELIEIIDRRPCEQLVCCRSLGEDGPQLSQLAGLWKEYGEKIEQLMHPDRLPVLQWEIAKLRRRRVEKMLRKQS